MKPIEPVLCGKMKLFNVGSTWSKLNDFIAVWIVMHLVMTMLMSVTARVRVTVVMPMTSMGFFTS